MRIVQRSKHPRFTIAGLVRIGEDRRQSTVESREHCIRAPSEAEAMLRFHGAYFDSGGALQETVRVKEVVQP